MEQWIESKEYSEKGWGTLSQGESELADPVPYWKWVLRRTFIPLLPRAKKVLRPGSLLSAHFPLFNLYGLAEALGGSGVSWNDNPAMTVGSEVPHEQFASSAIVSFLPVKPWEVSYLRKEQ